MACMNVFVDTTQGFIKGIRFIKREHFHRNPYDSMELFDIGNNYTESTLGVMQ